MQRFLPPVKRTLSVTISVKIRVSTTQERVRDAELLKRIRTITVKTVATSADSNTPKQLIPCPATEIIIS